MHVNAQPMRCSQCRTVDNYEHFHRRKVSGVRCLTCGHEKITRDDRYEYNQTPGHWYTSSDTIDQF